MKNRLIITALMTYSAVSAVFATNFEGAWKGPKELMVNLCIDGQKLSLRHFPDIRLDEFFNDSVRRLTDNGVNRCGQPV